MIVVDASAIVRMLVGYPADPALGAVLAEDDLHAPTLLHYEVASALRGHVLAGQVSAHRLDEALAFFGELDVEQHSMSGALAAILALRENFTVYDAAYIVLALALDAPLVTSDWKHLEAARLGLDVRVFASP